MVIQLVLSAVPNHARDAAAEQHMGTRITLPMTAGKPGRPSDQVSGL